MRSSGGTSSGWQWASAGLSRSRQSTRPATPASSSRLWKCTARWTATSWEPDPRFREHPHLSILISPPYLSRVFHFAGTSRWQGCALLPAPSSPTGSAGSTCPRNSEGPTKTRWGYTEPEALASTDCAKGWNIPAGNSRSSRTPRLSTIWPGRNLYIGPVISMMSSRSSEVSRILSPSHRRIWKPRRRESSSWWLVVVQISLGWLRPTRRRGIFRSCRRNFGGRIPGGSPGWSGSIRLPAKWWWVGSTVWGWAAWTLSRLFLLPRRWEAERWALSACTEPSPCQCGFRGSSRGWGWSWKGPRLYLHSYHPPSVLIFKYINGKGVSLIKLQT